MRLALPARGKKRIVPVPLGMTTAGTVTVAVPLFVLSTPLVAVIVMVCALAADAGAVNNPALVIALAEAVHVTVCAGLPVPVTAAANC